MPNAVKKISVAIVLALFYSANVVYERGHTPELSMAAMPQLSTLTQTPNADAQSAGSGNSPQQTTVAARGSSSLPRTTAQGKQAAASGQVLAESAATNPASVAQTAPGAKTQTAAKSSSSSAPAAKSVTVPPLTPPPPGHVTTTSSTPPPSSSSPPPAQTAQPQGQYKNGSYTGTSVDALFGMVQVQVTISNGKISNVQFLTYPNDNSTSLQKSNMAMPRLVQEAIAAQSASVQTVSGASETSAAFVQSLTSALSQAKV